MYRKKIPEYAGNVPEVPEYIFRALRADVPLFPESLTRKLYRKKIPENTIKVPGVPIRYIRFFALFTLRNFSFRN
jgi:hypothetical protein